MGSTETSFASLKSDRVEKIATRLLGAPNKRLSTSSELRWGARGSFSVIPERGVFFDNETGKSGGVLDLLVYTGAASDRRGAAQLLAQDGDLPPRETAEERQERDEAENRRRTARMAAAAALWRTGVALADPAVIYLRQARRIRAPLAGAAVRSADAAPLTPYAPDGRTAPAMLARVVDGSGAPIGLHITYLRRDGSGKAEITTPRKMIGLVAGGHVRLISGVDVVVGEGIESTCSAWEAAAADRGSGADLGASAGLSAGGVAAYVWPRGTRGLIISPDRDAGRAGERGARALAKRAHASGLEVGFLWPPEGFSDWNALAMKGRAS